MPRQCEVFVKYRGSDKPVQSPQRYQAWQRGVTYSLKRLSCQHPVGFCRCHRCRECVAAVAVQGLYVPHIVLLLKLRAKAAHGRFFNSQQRRQVQQYIGPQRRTYFIKGNPNIRPDTSPGPSPTYRFNRQPAGLLVVWVNLPRGGRIHQVAVGAGNFVCQLLHQRLGVDQPTVRVSPKLGHPVAQHSRCCTAFVLPRQSVAIQRAIGQNHHTHWLAQRYMAGNGTPAAKHLIIRMRCQHQGSVCWQSLASAVGNEIRFQSKKRG